MAQSLENPFNRLKQRLEEAARRMRSDFEPTNLAFDPNAERVSLELDYLTSQLTGFAVNNSVPRILQLRTQFGQELTTVRRLEDEQLRGVAEVSPVYKAGSQPTDICYSLPRDFFQDGNISVVFRPDFSTLRCNNSETVKAITSVFGEQEHSVLWAAMHVLRRHDLYKPEEWVADSLAFTIAMRRGSAVYSKVCFIDHKSNALRMAPQLKKTRSIDRNRIQISRQFCLFPQNAQPEIEMFIEFGSIHVLQEGTSGKEKARLGKKETLPAGS